jgi:hypothetical protein
MADERRQMSEKFADEAPEPRDQSAASEIVPGLTVVKPSGKVTVTAVEGEEVRFRQESPDGTIKKSNLPLSLFKMMVAGEVAAGRYTLVPAIEIEQQAALAEFSAEDLAGFRRQDALYASLSEGDRAYVVARWDQDQGLELLSTRLQYKSDAPGRQRRRRMWTTLALIPAVLFCWWLSNLMDRDRKRSEDSYVLDSLREHSKMTRR